MLYCCNDLLIFLIIDALLIKTMTTSNMKEIKQIFGDNMNEECYSGIYALVLETGLIDFREITKLVKIDTNCHGTDPCFHVVYCQHKEYNNIMIELDCCAIEDLFGFLKTTPLDHFKNRWYK